MAYAFAPRSSPNNARRATLRGEAPVVHRGPAQAEGRGRGPAAPERAHEGGSRMLHVHARAIGDGQIRPGPDATRPGRPLRPRARRALGPRGRARLVHGPRPRRARHGGGRARAPGVGGRERVRDGRGDLEHAFPGHARLARRRAPRIRRPSRPALCRHRHRRVRARAPGRQPAARRDGHAGPRRVADGAGHRRHALRRHGGRALHAPHGAARDERRLRAAVAGARGGHRARGAADTWAWASPEG